MEGFRDDLMDEEVIEIEPVEEIEIVSEFDENESWFLFVPGRDCRHIDDDCLKNPCPDCRFFE